MWTVQVTVPGHLCTATLFGIYFQPSFVVAVVIIYMNLLTVHSFFFAISTNVLCLLFVFILHRSYHAM